MEERIQKVLARAGVASRRVAEQMILEGRVTVNGSPVAEMGMKVDPARDHIKVDGRLIPTQETFVYLLLNKPKGVVSTVTDPEGRPVVIDLVKGVGQRVYPVGRLDINSEGVMILTNDGDLANKLTAPKHRCPKTYLVKVSGVPTGRNLARLERGVTIDGTRYGPCRLRVLKSDRNSWVCAELRDGKNHHLKKIFEWIGHPVSKIRRIAFAFLTAEDLAPGKFRHLTPGEVSRLKRGAFEPKSPIDVFGALAKQGVKLDPRKVKERPRPSRPRDPKRAVSAKRTPTKGKPRGSQGGSPPSRRSGAKPKTGLKKPTKRKTRG